MTKKELSELIKTSRDLSIIENKLLALGYFNCEDKDGFGDINLTELYAGNEKDQIETKTYKTTTPLYWLDGEIITNVPVKQGYEFIIITQYEEYDKKPYKHGNLFPNDFKAFAKACEA